MKNNKGFAITTLVYGLSIMGILIIAILMGTMSTTRANNKALAKAIEKELNKGSAANKMVDGTNIIGGDYLEDIFLVPAGDSGWYRIELWGSSGAGGKGAYTTGIIRLNEYDTLHIYVGKSGSGKETDIRLTGGPYDDRTSYDSRIMVAAGGGKNSGADGGTLDGYKNMTPAGIPKTFRGVRGTNGGDGYFPSNADASGGASYISGYGGGYSIIKGAVQNNPTYQFAPTTYNEEEDTYSYGAFGAKYIFYSGIMVAGVNSSAGRAKIEKLSNEGSIPIRNTKLNNVKEIIDCMAGTNRVSRISAVNAGVEKSITQTPQAVTDPEGLGGSCKKVTFSQTRLDEVTTFHTSGENPSKHRIIIVKNNGSREVLKGFVNGTTSDKSETATVAGYKISCYQFDSMNDLPTTGLYYIFPALAENKVLNAVDNNQLTSSLLSGGENQKWQIEAGDGAYKLIESSHNKALEIVSGQPKTINAARTTQTEQKWQIIPLKNGYYRIKNVSSGKYLQYLSSSMTLTTATDDGTRFKFYKLDLS